MTTKEKGNPLICLLSSHQGSAAQHSTKQQWARSQKQLARRKTALHVSFYPIISGKRRVKVVDAEKEAASTIDELRSSFSTDRILLPTLTLVG